MSAPGSIPVASRRPRSSVDLDVCGIRLGPPTRCVLGLLGSQPGRPGKSGPEPGATARGHFGVSAMADPKGGR